MLCSLSRQHRDRSCLGCVLVAGNVLQFTSSQDSSAQMRAEMDGSGKTPQNCCACPLPAEAVRCFGVVALTECKRLHFVGLADTTADAGFLSKANLKGVLPNAATYIRVDCKACSVTSQGPDVSRHFIPSAACASSACRSPFFRRGLLLVVSGWVLAANPFSAALVAP